jgi:hypothetical protein
VVLGLERLKQVDDVGVGAKAKVDTKLLGSLVNGKGRRAVDGGRWLRDDLDGHEVIRHEILCLEDHAEGAMVEGCDGLIASVEHGTWSKVIAHAIHFECCDGTKARGFRNKDRKQATRKTDALSNF